ncbi:MAG: hypothetical protein QNJ20_18360 [Paracoccaceae bacterium]|nr:hypothetical protein [Paracoccaceae bacterium]
MLARVGIHSDERGFVTRLECNFQTRSSDRTWQMSGLSATLTLDDEISLTEAANDR